MKTLTMPLYYYDDNGYKIGPIKKQQLFALAERGEIKPETRITDDKIEIKAKHIPKLKFYAPEYHRAEELFDPKNINYDEPLPVDSTPAPSASITSTTQTTEVQKETNPNVAVMQYDFSKLTRHPLIIATVVLIAITTITSTITCFVLVSSVIAVNREIRKLNNLEWEPVQRGEPLNLEPFEFKPLSPDISYAVF